MRECGIMKRRWRPAFTLVELVVSSAAAVILVGGMAGAIVLATQALPDRQGVLGETASAARALARINQELACAQSIVQHGANGITFTVPDQNGDGSPEIIAYSWGGGASDPLERQFNGADPEVLIADVVDFSLDYSTYSVSREGDPTRNESDERELAYWENWLTLGDQAVEDKKWRGEAFLPSLPADAVQYRITRVHFYVRADGPAIGMSSVELRLADTGFIPQADVLAATPMPESALLDVFSWYRVDFPAAPQIDAGQPVAVVIRHVSDARSCKVKYQSLSVWATNIAFVKTDDDGKTWKTGVGQSLLFHAYGTITTLGPPEIITVNYLRALRVSIQTAADTAPVESTVVLLNEPELPL